VARPLIATKLYVPKLRRGLVERRRLGAQLRRGAESRLTLVSAPAGFGKTTLLAEWLGETPGQDRAVAWLSLDLSDNEPESFWTYVVTALQTAVPGVASAALELIASSPLPTDLVLTTLLNELAAAPGEVWLVLDDYHLVDSHDVRDGIIFLLEHLPTHVHVVLSTRADPDLPLARWRVRGELVEIRAADLRFTSDEAARYLNEATGLHLAAGDIAILEERTEGWIAALQLAALSLQQSADASGFIARFAGNDRYIVDYLVEEVLAHQSEPVREFLLRTAVLNAAPCPRKRAPPKSSSAPWRTPPARSPSSRTWCCNCTSGRAAGTRRMTLQRTRYGTHWRRGTLIVRPTSWSWPCRRSDATGKKRSCWVG